MKERPILFSTPMVRAILDGRKAQTRRVVKFNAAGRVQYDGRQWHPDDPHATKACPYGKVGDRLWVRESFIDLHKTPVAGAGAEKFAGRHYQFRATNEPEVSGRWTPSIHMPRAASRITLEITGVRVERLQSISEEDATAEGVPIDDEPCDHIRRSCEEIGCLGPGYRSSFCGLWHKINGKKYPWDSNPFVWVVEFKQV